jgi:hypothetical protein
MKNNYLFRAFLITVLITVLTLQLVSAADPSLSDLAPERQQKLRFGLTLYVKSINIEPQEITAGSTTTIKVLLENIADSSIRDVVTKIDLSNSQFVPLGIAEKKTRIMYSNETIEVNFSIIASPDAKAGAYRIPLKFEYLDAIGTKYSENDTIGIRIVGKGKLDIANVKTDPAKVLSGKEVTLMVRIENSGTGDAKSVKASIDLPFQGTKTAFLGKIEPNEDAPAVFNLQASEAGNYKYKLTIEYEDDLGEHEYQQDLDIVVYSARGYSPTIIIFLAAVIILGLVVYLRHRKSREK